MSPHLLTFTCLALLSLSATTPTQADIYTNVGLDANEEIHLSNIPIEGAAEVLVAEAVATVSAPSRQTTAAVRAAALPFAAAVNLAARDNALEPALIHAVIAAESNHNPHAVSPSGARGLMQLMPETARHLSLRDPFDPEQNIRAGAMYLRELREMFKGDLGLALAAYNAGPGAVLRYGNRIPPYAETRRYVPRVLNLYRELQRQPM